MGTRVLVLVGTKKGGFILESDGRRRNWSVRGPFCAAWPILHMQFDPATGAIYAGGGSEWYGPAVWKSDDLARTWSHSSEGITFGDDGPRITRVWNVTPAHGVVYAGSDPAGLFRSDDGGRTWRHVEGLREHPSRSRWEPGPGGQGVHSIVPHPTDPRQIWVAIAGGAGTFYSADGGATWSPRNRNVRADFLPEKYPETGQCVHKLVMAPGRPDYLYQQNHCGVYRSRDGGQNWEEITAGLPSQFGFPIVVHPRDPRTIYVVPLNGDDSGRFMPDGRAAVWRSADAGDSWIRLSEGLPQENAYVNVLRDAMAVDPLEPAGVYFGTSTGQLYASRDEGDSWTALATHLPPILSVETAVVDG